MAENHWVGSGWAFRGQNWVESYHIKLASNGSKFGFNPKSYLIDPKEPSFYLGWEFGTLEPKIGPSCARLALKVKDLGQIGCINSALKFINLPNIPNDMLYPAGAFMPLPLNTFAPSGTTKR